MKQLLIVTAAVLTLSACAMNGNGNQKYVYVGCHTVNGNPGNDGSEAYGPFGSDIGVLGNTIYFKQVRNDGTVGDMTTSTPCE